MNRTRKNQSIPSNPTAQVSRNQRGNRARTVISRPVAISVRERNTGPNYAALPRGGIRVRHREMIAVLSTSDSDPTYLSYFINPGEQTLFPWLSEIAPNYEKCKFNSLSFRYDTAAPTDTQGSVGMAVDYDINDDPAISLIQLMSYEGAVDSALYDNFKLDANTRMMNTKNQGFYLTTNYRRTTQNLTEYYAGLLQIYLSQTTAAVEVARFWVEYDVSLITPQQTRDVDSVHFSFPVSTVITVAHDYVSDYLLSQAPTRLGYAWEATGGHLVCRRSGTFLCEVGIGATGTLSAATLTFAGDATGVVAQANAWSADDTLVTGAWIITAEVGQYFDLTVGVSGFTSTSGDFRLSRYDSLFL